MDLVGLVFVIHYISSVSEGHVQNFRYAAMWKSRQDVINTLRNSTLLSVTEVKFNNEFSIPFNVGSTMFYLNVVIPDAFPSQPLKVTLSPPAQHPLVNEKFQVVGSPAINGAISMQCNLESIVADAIQG